MNRKFLKQIWQRGRDGKDFDLPYLDQAQEIIGFLDEMNLTSVKNMQSPLTQEDAAWLLSKYRKEDIMEVLAAMENYKNLNKKYKSAKLTANQWLRKRARDNNDTGTKRKIPVA